MKVSVLVCVAGELVYFVVAVYFYFVFCGFFSDVDYVECGLDCVAESYFYRICFSKKRLRSKTSSTIG